LPPLPAAFHDLYASTVRTATSDDPALHQGRTRQIPHLAGYWPSHLYIEWHPSAAVHALLAGLIATLQSHNPQQTPPIASFLTSDLGAPQPLHISLSRPVTFTTADKDIFLAHALASIAGCGLAPFELSCRGVGWHRTEESGRSFLVLRVASSAAEPAASANSAENPNPELTALLKRCNTLVSDYGQPQLYQWAVQEEGGDGDGNVAIGNAFHVSIAWSFAKPTEELERLTGQVFSHPEVKDRIAQLARIPVDGVKAKVGNVVTHMAL
ncbi:U6 snRNA phosphodiesterase Usb1, partial [Lasiosphaeris hirsuta]